MINFVKNIFKKKSRFFTNEEYEIDYELKSAGLETILGPMHNLVGHAIIPFSLGGAVDMYYFPNHIKGTGFATMELLDPDGNGPLQNEYGTYELIAFTKHKISAEEFDLVACEDDNSTISNYDKIERHICGIFTGLGQYSKDAKLNPLDTCELPEEDNDNIYIVFDLYEPDGKKFKIGNRGHHLLLCIEVFKTEIDFARSVGTVKLLDKLKESSFYPYSDLDRQPVV